MDTYATTKGQIVIPAALRKKFGITKGTRIVVTENEDSITLTPITEQYLLKLQGSLKGVGGTKFLLEERKKDLERE